MGDADCPAGQTCVDGICKEPGDCIADGDCTGTECSTCENNVCKDPECCKNEDCQNTPNLQCSICNGDNTCSQPQCCVDADCTEPGYICVGNACVPEGECNANKPCGGQNSLCDITTTPHGECEWCDLVNHECKPGCDSGDNCPSEKPICSKPDHQCNSPGTNGVESITIVTDTCSSCAGSGNPTGLVEGGVSLQLDGLYNTHCNSNGLDNGELVDYDNGKTAVLMAHHPMMAVMMDLLVANLLTSTKKYLEEPLPGLVMVCGQELSQIPSVSSSLQRETIMLLAVVNWNPEPFKQGFQQI